MCQPESRQLSSAFLGLGLTKPKPQLRPQPIKPQTRQPSAIFAGPCPCLNKPPTQFFIVTN